MKDEVLKMIQIECDRVPEAFGGQVSEEEVEKAEGILGVKIQDDYKEFIRRFGAGCVGQAVILGLREAEFFPTPSFIEESLDFRKHLPSAYSKMVVIGVDGAGNPIGFIYPSEMIFVYDHDFGGRYDLANSFEDYILKALNRTLGIHF
ncbi:SMI1/KNR4 family protein [Kroppenstedtia pulmonis]|uniref:SMI1/KNR4 family protein n=1 Tax=Kroppenstedtia pulmonis TaxID=1380685 RepID=A0A7D3Y8V7_9BACL|nr:SMI1/KNR4 family protein [Kroppenstedtia pulmonis]QKG83921.1 SMI1/KNR4 family protein [Kroppenstedtia pulmonis]